MRKTLLLAVGALALVASMAIAQSAFAVHETVGSTKAMTGSVVPTYKNCPSGDAHFHAAPVSFPSCTGGLATNDTSALLKPKSFGLAGAFTSSYNINIVRPSTPPPTGFGSADVVDVRVTSSANGTLCENPTLFLVAVRATNCPNPTNTGVCTTPSASPFCPYSGNTIGESTLRTTDQDNCTGPCDNGTLHGTVQDFDFSFIIPCVAGNCKIDSTSDAQFGTSYTSTSDPTVDGKRADIEIMSVRTQDPGPNGTAGTGCPLTCGDGDETDAARQGLFIK
jgi:hypothetical protein